MKTKALAGLIVLVAVTAVTLSDASAGEGFRKRHPRRAEVNRRERRQQKRIAEGIESGKISPAEAAKLERQEASIKREERADVKANGGHLTKGEEHKLNQELNQTSREIATDKKQ